MIGLTNQAVCFETSQLIFTYSKWTTETVEKSVKYVKI